MNNFTQNNARIAARTTNLAPKVIAALGVTALLLLSACHTTAGAGKDLSAAGGAITHSADQHSY